MEIVFLGLAVAVVIWIALKAGAAHARTCQVCRGPRDPHSNAPGVWQFGVLACEACGAKLHQRFKDEPHPPYPPYPPA
jgi:hypothetical protein